jgi:hypothetical protein
MFHQPEPHGICQARGIGFKCRNPRCSLACRRAYAFKEATIMSRHLRSLPAQTRIYAGTLTVQADLTADEHRAIRRRFLAALSKGFGGVVKLHVIGEVCDYLRIHYHYVMLSSVDVTHAAVREMWHAACRGLPVKVQHEPPRDIEAWVKYMFADCRKFVRLMMKGKGMLPLTWGTRLFFPAGSKVAFWKAAVEEWRAAAPPAPRRRLRLVRLLARPGDTARPVPVPAPPAPALGAGRAGHAAILARRSIRPSGEFSAPTSHSYVVASPDSLYGLSRLFSATMVPTVRFQAPHSRPPPLLGVFCLWKRSEQQQHLSVTATRPVVRVVRSLLLSLVSPLVSEKEEGPLSGERVRRSPMDTIERNLEGLGRKRTGPPDDPMFIEWPRFVSSSRLSG